MYFSLSNNFLILNKGHISGKIKAGFDLYDPFYIEDDIALRLVFNKETDAFVSFRYLTDSKERPLDYVFLDVNDNYESLTGFNRNDIKGRLVTDIAAGHIDYAKELIRKFYKTAVLGQDQYFNIFSEITEKDYTIYAYSPEKYYFNLIFKEVSDRNRSEYKASMQEFLYFLDSINTSGLILFEKDNPIGSQKRLKLVSEDTAKKLGLIDKGQALLRSKILKDIPAISVTKRLGRYLKSHIIDDFSLISKVGNTSGNNHSLLVMVQKI